jgi:hypothetical protein
MASEGEDDLLARQRLPPAAGQGKRVGAGLAGANDNKAADPEP